MARVTSKLQVTVPKAIALQHGIRPGDEIDWIPAGDSIRVVKRNRKRPASDVVRERLRLFDEATERQRRRQVGRSPGKEPGNRGWRREDLYVRGRSR